MKRTDILIFFCFTMIIVGFAAQMSLEKPSVEMGREIYNENCAVCHGEAGDGSGTSGAFDFTDHEQMITKNSSYFFEKITAGIPGTAMPAFNGISIDNRWNVIAYSWTFWANQPDTGKGKNIFEKNCALCHGLTGDGSGLAGAFNFTDIEVMRGVKPALFFDSVSNGKPGTAMPAWNNTLSENERWDTVKYVWNFQFGDYPGFPRSSETPTPVQEIPSGESIWYRTAGGVAIIFISAVLTLFVIYLFVKGVIER